MSSGNRSPANRQAKQERAQAAAMRELEIEAGKRREKSKILRKLRIESEQESARDFAAWRQRHSAAGK